MEQNANENFYGGVKDGRKKFKRIDRLFENRFDDFIYLKRIRIAADFLKNRYGAEAAGLRILIICGGNGKEAVYLSSAGFNNVTVSDISPSALEMLKAAHPEINTQVLDAENMDTPDKSFDVVLVQDGLHHLPRPVNGFTEMLRVAGKAVIVIEPHTGLVTKMFGREYECFGSEDRPENITNYVFRWDKEIFSMAAKSYLLKNPHEIVVRRTWHHLSLMNIGRIFGRNQIGILVARGVYGILGTVFGAWANQMIGFVTLDSASGNHRPS